MAEWLRPQSSITNNGINIRRISVGSISCPSQKSIGWAFGVKMVKTRAVITMAGIDQILEGRMAEWLMPRTSIAENGLNIRRISVGSILSLKEVHRFDGWC